MRLGIAGLLAQATRRLAPAVAGFCGASILAAACLHAPLSAAQSAPARLQPSSVEAFFDAAWEDDFATDLRPPGLVITVVQGDNIVLNKGYGVSDSERGTAADPERTRLRIGSVSKLFTALTALALVDQGNLQMDRNVNDYLRRVQIEDDYSTPVTVRTLLSHLSGLNADVGGYMSYDNSDTANDFDEYQRRLVRVRNSGVVYGYDNMGIGLLGYIAGLANESTFPRAVEQTILEPLGMKKTTMGVPGEQLRELAACHSWNSDGETVQCQHKFMRDTFMGAGDITTTGDDMARFMSAMLGGGCGEAGCVLTADSFRDFTDMSLNRPHPAGLGMGYVMLELPFESHYAIGHSGGQDGFSTLLVLFPESSVGLFISQMHYPGIPDAHNLAVGLQLISTSGAVNPGAKAMSVSRSFADRFVAPDSERAVSLDLAESIAIEELAGLYLRTRQVGDQFMSRLMHRMDAVRVTVSGDTVMIGDRGPFKVAGPGVLAQEGSDTRYLAFRRGGEQFLYRSDGLPINLLMQVPRRWEPRVTVLPMLLSLLALPLALLATLFFKGGSAGRQVSSLVALSVALVTVGLVCDMAFYDELYYPGSGTLAIMAWRGLIMAGWLLALYVLYVMVQCRQTVFAMSGVGNIATSALFGVFAVCLVSLLALLVYWDMVGTLLG
ncbi:MAG: serine hydrolase domain-containing protein [Pseudomonadota bacterium]